MRGRGLQTESAEVRRNKRTQTLSGRIAVNAALSGGWRDSAAKKGIKMENGSSAVPIKDRQNTEGMINMLLTRAYFE